MDTLISINRQHQHHAQSGHVERPERLDAIVSALDDASLTTIREVPFAPARLEEAALVHDAGYLERLQTSVAAGGGQLDPDTYVTGGSLDVALEALGGLLHLTRQVMTNNAANAFAITRPPGHHALPDQAMGFCLFGNAAIAARVAQQEYGIERVAIIDFDVHHGNGTQDIFYDDPQVLYLSTHQWPLYPGTGSITETGTGRAEGSTINVPLPAGTGDAGYIMVFDRIFAPIVSRFKPELIVLSAGYDAHWRDPLGGMHVTAAGFAAMTLRIMEWADQCCQGRLVALLEGGYDTTGLARSVLETLKILSNPNAEVVSDAPDTPPQETQIESLIEEIIHFHRI